MPNATETRPNPDPTPNEQSLWYLLFAIGHPKLKQYQTWFKRLPAEPRCRLCNAPFRGAGGALMRLQRRKPSNKNPHYCNKCDEFILKNPGGAEVELTMLFVDVRDSTKIGESLTPTEFSRLMNGFYREATSIIYRYDGFIDKFVGDEVIALFPPGFCGPNHARLAVEAAKELAAVRQPYGDGRALEVGVGVHTGVAYIGTVAGEDRHFVDVTVLGDAMNTAARLAGSAGKGEAVISQATAEGGGLRGERTEERSLALKGKAESLRAYSIRD